MGADPAGKEHTIRVVGIYATKWIYRADSDAPAIDWFTDTRLEMFEQNFRNVLPRLPRPIAADKFAADEIRFARQLDVIVTGADMFLFALPSDHVVAAFTVDCRATPVSIDPAPAAEMLDEFADDAFTIKGKSLPALLTSLAPKGTRTYEPEAKPPVKKKKTVPMPEKTPAVEIAERHQIVFVSAQDRLGPAVVDKMLYRRQPQLWKEFAQRKEPVELNERGQYGVVTTNVSFVQGHDSMLEDSVFLSTVQAVGTLSRFRQIWDRAYEVVRKFRLEKQRDVAGTQQRDDLEELVDDLGNLEFDLTFSVEFPLMRIESYHSALSDVLDLDGQSNRLSRMFNQLGGSVQSEIAAIDIRDTRMAEFRRRRNEWAFNVLALLSVTVGALLAFFGTSTHNVRSDESMFDWRTFWPEYLGAFVLGAIPVAIVVLANLFRRSQPREPKASRPGRPMWVPLRQRGPLSAPVQLEMPDRHHG
jgi:hypothetical protein